MSMSESLTYIFLGLTEFSEVLPSYFLPPTSSSVRVGGLVVVVLIMVPKLLNPFCLPPFSYVVNECCRKGLRPAFCWKWTYRSVLRATTTTTTTTTIAVRIPRETSNYCCTYSKRDFKLLLYVFQERLQAIAVRIPRETSSYCCTYFKIDFRLLLYVFKERL